MRQVDKFYIPDWSNEVHYEAELVIRINRLGKNIESRFAYRYYEECTVGIDFTARDVQSELKAKSLPWEKAKAFDRSAVLGDWISCKDLDLNNTEFSLSKNGERVQFGNTAHMLSPIDILIEHISKYFTLKIGDLVFTGTPAGVGPVSSGDILMGYIFDRQLLKVDIR
jgi:2-keto-4-pentenoate hydratase/2-oxohepta-3-ene-1,7-dioic acid hydratase in catechol pathway